jgi:hypothetical protein
MTTLASDIINRGLRILKIIDSDSTADATQLANGLIVLNSLLDELNSDVATVFEEVQESLTLTGATSYTMGSSGALNTTWPAHIVGAFTNHSNVDYPPLRIVTKSDWDVIQGKTDAGFPTVLWADEAYPLMVLHFWPNPTSGTAYITSMKQITEFAASSTALSLPPAYREMLTWNFAVRFSPEGGVLTPQAMALAASTLRSVRKRNRKIPEMRLDTPGLSSRFGSTIFSG